MDEEMEVESKPKRGIFSMFSPGDLIALVVAVGSALGSYNVFVDRLARVEVRIEESQKTQDRRDNMQDMTLREMKTDIKESLTDLKVGLGEVNRKLDSMRGRQ